jgi:hypothetical protein|tara:strand:+ start:710 stop:1102 length:393 start_codon:yes stop_codon:yes gene_type:complete
MGKKAVIGTSPKDSSTDKMDRYIQRNERKEQQNLHRHGKKDLSKIPMDEWPLKKQLEYLNNRSDADKFKDKYSSYSFWYEEVKKKSGVYPTTFIDWSSRADTKQALQDMYAKCVSVKDAVYILKREHGIY